MVKFIRNIIHKLHVKYKLARMDSFWRYMGYECWESYPPSFYYTHTKEEIERIRKEDAARVRERIERLW